MTTMRDDTISRAAAIDALADYIHNVDRVYSTGKLTHKDCMDAAHSVLDELPSAQPESKYEYHYDHTDCIWFRPEARNRCPSTCAQYRDGWNDAMNYIFRDGKGYRPYRRNQKYEG